MSLITITIYNPTTSECRRIRHSEKSRWFAYGWRYATSDEAKAYYANHAKAQFKITSSHVPNR